MGDRLLSIKGGLYDDGEPVVIWTIGEQVHLLSVDQARWAIDELTRATDAVAATAELIDGRPDVLAAVLANAAALAS